MANVTFLSTNLPKFVAEAARRYMSAERALTIPQTNVGMQFGDTLLTISGTLPIIQSIDVATGNLVISFVNATPAATPVLTGTVLSDVTADNMAEVLVNSVVRLNAAEDAKIAALGTLPAGVDVTYSIANGQASFTAVLPYIASLDASGNQLITVSNYLV